MENINNPPGPGSGGTGGSYSSELEAELYFWVWRWEVQPNVWGSCLCVQAAAPKRDSQSCGMWREEALAANLMCLMSNVCSREQLFATPTLLSLQRWLKRVRVSKKIDNFIKDAAEDVFMGYLCGGPSGKAVPLKQVLMKLFWQVEVLGVSLAHGGTQLMSCSTKVGRTLSVFPDILQICSCRQAAEIEIMLFPCRK